MTGREYGVVAAAARAQRLSINEYNEYVRRTLGVAPPGQRRRR